MKRNHQDSPNSLSFQVISVITDVVLVQDQVRKLMASSDGLRTAKDIVRASTNVKKEVANSFLAKMGVEKVATLAGKNDKEAVQYLCKELVPLVYLK
jgi:hypothetical protein